MIIVVDQYNKQKTILTNDIPKAPKYFHDNHFESLDGVLTYEFEVRANDPATAVLVAGNSVLVRDLDKRLMKFTILRTSESQSGGQYVRRVFCENSAVGDLISHVVTGKLLSATNPKQAGTYVLAGTGWEVGEVDFVGIADVDLRDFPTGLAGLHKIREVFGLELEFTIYWNGQRIVSQLVHFVKRRGRRTGKRFTVGKDLSGITRTEDRSDMCTALVPVGKADEEGNRLTLGGHNGIFEGWVSPPDQNWIGDNDALQRFGVAGKHIFGRVEFSNVADVYALMKEGVAELKKRNKPRMTYEMSVLLLERLARFKDTEKVRLGDYVLVKDTNFEPYLAVDARAIAINRSYTDPSKDSVVMGEFIPVIIEPNKQIEAIQSQINNNMSKWEAKGETVYKSKIAPIKSKRFPDMLWLDTAREPNVMKRWDAENEKWVKATATEASEVGAETPSGAKAKADEAEKKAIETAEQDATQKKAEAIKESNEYTNEVVVEAMEETIIKTKSYVDGLVPEIEAELQKHADAVAKDAEDNAKLYTEQYSEKALHVDNKAPADTKKLWMDTTKKPFVLKKFDGKEWVSASPQVPADIGAPDINDVMAKANEARDSAITEAKKDADTKANKARQDAIAEAKKMDESIKTIAEQAEKNANTHTDEVRKQVEEALKQDAQNKANTAEKNAVDKSLQNARTEAENARKKAEENAKIASEQFAKDMKTQADTQAKKLADEAKRLATEDAKKLADQAETNAKTHTNNVRTELNSGIADARKHAETKATEAQNNATKRANDVKTEVESFARNAGNITEGTLAAQRLHGVTISGKSAKIVDIDAGNINVGTLDASKVKVIKLDAESITTGVLNVGSAQLARGVNFSKGWTPWKRSDSLSASLYQDYVILTSKIATESFLWTPRFELTGGQTKKVTLSYEWHKDTQTNYAEVFLLTSKMTAEEGKDSYGHDYVFNLTGDEKPIDLGNGWFRVQKTFNLHNDTLSAVLRFDHNGTSNTGGSSVRYRNVMLNYGDIALKYSPHTDDIIGIGAINAKHIVANSVQAQHITSNAVTADKIGANAITADKIQANAVNASKIVANAIVADKIASNAVTTDKISANAVNASKIVAGAINGNHITANAVNANHILTGAITAEKLHVLAKNLVANTSLTGNDSLGWRVGKHATSTSLLRGSTNMGDTLSHKFTTAEHETPTTYDSLPFEVDPNQTYKFAIGMFLDKNTRNSSQYFGLKAYDKNMKELPMQPLNPTTGALSGAPRTNPYFWSGKEVSGSWRYMEGYAVSSQSGNNEAPQGRNIQSSYQMHPATKFMIMRFYSGYYPTAKNQAMEVLWHSPSVTAVDSGTIVAERIVTGTLDANKVNVTNLKANNITSGTMTADRINGGTINAKNTKIINVDAGNINAGTLNASQVNITNMNASNITTGTLSADRIGARSISAEKMVIGDFTNLCPNPMFERGNADGWHGTVNVLPASNASVPAGAPTQYVGRATKRDSRGSDWFDVRQGDRFFVSYDVASKNSAHGTTIGIYFFDKDGKAVSASGSGYKTKQNGQWQRHEGYITAPNNAVKAYVWVQINAFENFGEWFFTNVVVRRRVDSKLIVDGSIQALQIATNAVTADKIVAGAINASKISANAIDASKIASNAVTTDKLSANAVNASKIQAGAITADKIATNAISASMIQTGTLDASKVTINNLTANRITGGTMSADRISGGTINANTTNIINLKAQNIASGKINADNVEISNGRVTIGKTGVQVTEADFLVKNARTGFTHSLEAQSNLIGDHSFEMLSADGDIWNQCYRFINWEFITENDRYGRWARVGSPRMIDGYNTDVPEGSSAFGRKAVLVNSSAYVYQDIDAKAGKKYTISFHASKPFFIGAGAPQVQVEYVKNGSVISSEVKNFAVPTTPAGEYVRYGFTVTAPATLNHERSNLIRLRFRVNGNEHVLIDGVQAVQGDKAVPYDSEDSLWSMSNGRLSPVRMHLRNLMMQGNTRIEGGGLSVAGRNANGVGIEMSERLRIWGDNPIEVRQSHVEATAFRCIGSRPAGTDRMLWLGWHDQAGNALYGFIGGSWKVITRL
ncbi:phage tail spike protein [Bacillus sp. SN10]|uniref:phage tail spike protein n=1 Tax=Bacillus sp. SN10 TaxID=2056493 RepID=UPI000C331644|nr:phage tail spike protein [Bacillus sp. SN10]PKJ52697.1 hypothetical protein CWE34_26620 [Bacillus sp. SN10]